MAYVSSSGVHHSPALVVLIIVVGVAIATVSTAVRVRQMRRYTKVSPWKKLLLWDTSPWSLTGRWVRQSADREQAEAERLATFTATQTALAQQHSAADPAARFGLATLPGRVTTAGPDLQATAASAGGFPPPSDAAPFPPPRPAPSAPTADDVLPHP